MSTHYVETQADLDAVYADFAAEWDQIPLGPYMHEAARRLELLHAAYFSMEVDPLGVAWASLADATVFAKGHDRILWETGRLEDSLTQDSPDAIRDIDAGQFAALIHFGTAVEYAHWHMTGTSRMPARMHTGITFPFIDAEAERVADYAANRLIPGASQQVAA